MIGNRLVNQDIWIAGRELRKVTMATVIRPRHMPYHRSREGQFIGNICRNIHVGKMWSDEHVVSGVATTTYGTTPATI